MALKRKIMELFQLGEIKDTIVGLVEAKVQLKKIEIQERVEYGIGKLILTLIQLFLVMLCLTLGLVLLGYFINLWLGAPWGYVLVLALALVALGAFYLKKEKIHRAIKKRIIKEVDAIDS